jgi:Cof subfamily protein (haloacid dehalogenase superfamily)
VTRGLPVSSDGLDALLQLSRIRLVAIDIDGTLLNQPSARVADVISDLNRSLRHYRRGVTLTLATGRAFEGARPVIERLRLLRKTPVILYNGAVICSADGLSIDRLHSLESTQIASIVKLASDLGLSSLVYQPELPFSLRDTNSPENASIVETVTGFSGDPGAEIEFNGLPIDWRTNLESVPDSAAAIVIPTPTNVPTEFTEAFQDVQGIALTKSSGAFLEIRPERANKGAALSVVASRRSLNSEQVLAIGDNDNDAEMLSWAGCSVAVANSTASAIAASDFVTKGTAGEGVVETLRLVADARRQRLAQ